jgi:DNA repair exonuclease SbcCD ATPase subunit
MASISKSYYPKKGRNGSEGPSNKSGKSEQRTNEPEGETTDSSELSAKERELADVDEQLKKRSEELDRDTKDLEQLVSQLEKDRLRIEEKWAELSRRERSLNADERRIKSESMRLRKLQDELHEWSTKLKGQEKELKLKSREAKQESAVGPSKASVRNQHPRQSENASSKSMEIENKANGGKQYRFPIRGDPVKKLEFLKKSAAEKGITFNGDHNKGIFWGHDLLCNYTRVDNDMILNIIKVPAGSTHDQIARLIENFFGQ